MSNTDQFVDAVYAELERLYEKDKNIKKGLLGQEPLKTIFTNYSDWLATNLAMSPKIAANAIYKDVIGIGYIDFMRRKLKRGVQLKNEPNYNFIYGTQQEIDQSYNLLRQLEQQNNQKFQLVTTALEKVKQISDQVKPAKNIFGKTTNVAKQQVQSFKMPRFATLETFLKMNDSQLKTYIKQLDKSIVAPPTQPTP
jgi:hypothetical protein